MGLEAHQAVDDVGPGLFEGAGPPDVGLLVEAGGHLDQHGHLLAVLGRPHQGGHHRAVAGGPVEALLDGQHVGVVGRLVDQLLDRRRERVVGVVDQHVLAVEHRKDARLLLPLDRGEGRWDQRGPRLVVQLGPVEAVDGPQAVEAQGAGEPVDVVGPQAELLGEPLDRTLRGPGIDLEAHHREEAPAAQLLLEGQQQVVGGVVIEGQVGVAGHPEDARLTDVHAREQLVDEGHQGLLEGDEAVARRAGAAAAPRWAGP